MIRVGHFAHLASFFANVRNQRPAVAGARFRFDFLTAALYLRFFCLLSKLTGPFLSSGRAPSTVFSH